MEKKKPLILRIFLWFLTTALILIVAAVVTIFAIWHNEIMSFASLREIRAADTDSGDGAVYEITVGGGFYLDKFIKQGGVSSDRELIEFVTRNLTKGLVDLGLESPTIGCSSFTAKSEDGKVLFARNYDYSKTNTCIVYTKAAKGRHATISTVDLRFLGIDTKKGITNLYDKITCLAATYVPLDGVNDAGVSCGIYMSYQGSSGAFPTNQETDKPDFTSTTMLRLILDYADNLDEAIEIASSFDLHDSAGTSYHYMVADSTGRSAILEWTCGTDATDHVGKKRTLSVIYNDDDAYIGEMEGNSEHQWITNFIVLPDYYKDSPSSQKFGYDRYIKLSSELSELSGTGRDERHAMELLRGVGRRSWSNDDANTVTAHSVVYNLTDRTALWVPNENFDDETAYFELKIK